MSRSRAALLLLALVGSSASSPATAEAAALANGDRAAAEAFFTTLAGHCGRAYAGRIVTNEPAAPNDDFAGQTLVMHVRRCSPQRIEVPFHVGANRSRTWILRLTATGLDFEHDHRHADGSPDVVTLYGGETTAPGSASRQEFPADTYSQELLRGAGLAASVANTWALEISEGTLIYELSRPGRLFRVAFDLTAPVAPPPAPWGHE